MLDMDALTTWINAVDVPFDVPVTVGPEMLEFGYGDSAGTLTLVPGGQGEKRQGAFEQVQVLMTLRTRSEKHKLLRDTFDTLDKALTARGNELLWGTYILYVLRQGTIDASFEEPERVSYIANYAIEMGL